MGTVLRGKYIIVLTVLIASILLSGCDKTEEDHLPETTAKEIEQVTKETEPIKEEIESMTAEIEAETKESEAAEEETEPATKETAETKEIAETKETADIPQERKEALAKFHEIHRNAVAGYVESETEKKIISYLQVPDDFADDTTWTGQWSHLECAGREFSSFGCGICCLANIYDTIIAPPDPITPDVMFIMTKEQTDYHPESGVGAVSWGQLKKMCTNFGLHAEVRTKPVEYAAFQNDVKNSVTTLVLVCKRDDDKLWFYTNGHYVNLWEYDEATDTAFVTDASGLFNRARVNLKDVYNALKSASSAQYMTVQGPAPQKVEEDAANEEK